MNHKEFAKVLKAVSRQVLFRELPHPTYILEKLRTEDPRETYCLLDDTGRQMVREYFRQWDMLQEFEEKLSELASDYMHMSSIEYRGKWIG